MSILVALEGLDGCGKSTLAAEVAKAIEKDPAFYPWVYLTKEPGSKWTSKGPDIRKLVLETPDFKPIERELLFYVDASIHARFIQNQGNAIFVSDRGLWSHLAYLRGYLKNGDINWDVYTLCKKLIEQVCIVPDVIVYLDADLDLMSERLVGKTKDAIESNGTQFFSAVLETYRDLAKHSPNTIVLNARATVCENTMKVVEYLKEVFDEKELSEGNK